MALATGTKLGSYEITSAIGAGGMGEVYKAHDTKLGRDVAIKILPEAFAHDADRLARFQREAKMLAALNHPNIATIHGLEQSNGTSYLVMELVSGETLAERVKREGAVPVEEALKIAVQIAEALEAAHEKNIIHRDLKPANVKMTPEGKVKVLDFGLAKAFAGDSGLDLSNAPTLTAMGTEEGKILGTPAYMSPEQARGKPIDKRADIWAFGCVLYELLSGRSPFRGETVTDSIAAVLEREPDWQALPTLTPAKIRDLLRRCLQKDKSLRLRDAGDARIEIQEALTEPSEGLPASLVGTQRTSTKGRGFRNWMWLGLAAVVGAVIGAGAFWQFSRHEESAPQPLVQFAISLPANESLREYGSSSVAVSPDGAALAYSVNRGDDSGIYLRSLDSLATKWLNGTERASNPFFSPDGRWLGFEAGSVLKRISLAGGAPQVICDVPPYFGGASWAPDDSIVFVPVFNSGLWRVPATGGKPVRLTTPDTKQREVAHLWPEVLPGGKEVLFTVLSSGSSGAIDESSIAVLSVETGERHMLVQGGFHGRYSPGGHLVYVRGSNLVAAPFDLRRLQVTGSSVSVVEGILGDTVIDAAMFSISSSGLLVYAPGTMHPPLRSLVWVDRNGHSEFVTEDKRAYSSPRVSPDGHRLALWMDDTTANVWLYDLLRGTPTRITFSADDHSAAWSPDGKRVAFESSRTGNHQLYVRRADGTGSDEQITSGPYEHYLNDWSPDGRDLAYTEYHPETGADLWVVGVDADRQPRPFLRTPFAEKKATFSRDGHWLAYVSNESGEDEVYVQPFPGPGEKWQISTGGGDEPAWALSGRELFYRNGGKMMSVSVTTKPVFRAGKPAILFSGLYHYNIVPNRSYDVAPDGRFIMVKEQESDTAARQINVVLGWSEDLKRRVPPGK